MGQLGFVEFDTAIGRCVLVWSDGGITGLLLPERSPQRLRALVGQRFPSAGAISPPPREHAAIEAVSALLSGGDPDLSTIVLDLRDVPEFHRRVYDVARSIPRGATLTYGQVASRVGEPGAARAVGQALGRNPIPIIVPCHRVLGAGGASGGFSAPGGVVTKQRILAIEGVELAVQPGLFDGDARA